jgi:hypothetical protein
MNCPYCDKPITIELKAPATRMDNRAFSLRIISSSKLPEVLHHSIQTYIAAWPSYTAQEIVARYIEIKRLKNDMDMVKLAEQYTEELTTYLNYLANRRDDDRPIPV